MAGTVNGTACDFVEGHATRLREESEVYFVNGHDGPGIILKGKRGGEFDFTAFKYGGTNGIFGWIQTLEDLQGSIVEIVNDVGEVFPNCYVQKAERLPIKAAIRHTGTIPEEDGLEASVQLMGVLLENPPDPPA
ncbi:MAG: hypothetical protein MI923_20410 [Phycisphaerales bacterium]|nr:hypothetical protein [Phycisphaerales bacterium]